MATIVRLRRMVRRIFFAIESQNLARLHTICSKFQSELIRSTAAYELRLCQLLVERGVAGHQRQRPSNFAARGGVDEF